VEREIARTNDTATGHVRWTDVGWQVLRGKVGRRGKTKNEKHGGRIVMTVVSITPDLSF